MEALPPYSQSVRWKEYSIVTPSFDLTPVEKPDMSPFLIHMTGPSEILSILNGENAPETLEDDEGFLMSTVPSQSKGNYETKIVCFSESPTFALDFFRYRSYTRWKADLRFGIGFSKTELITRGVRPAFYVDHNFLTKIMELRQVFLDDELQDFMNLVNTLYDYSTPLLENQRGQGFLWEREWRIAHEAGLTFKHSDVKVICCPDDERQPIIEALGSHAEGIQFVNSWKEYSDVTAFLDKQEKIWKSSAHVTADSSLESKIATALREIRKRVVALNSLKEYEANLLRAESELINVRQKKKDAESKLSELQAEYSSLKKEKEKSDVEQLQDGIPF